MKKVPLVLLGSSLTTIWVAWAVGCGSSTPAATPSASPTTNASPTASPSPSPAPTETGLLIDSLSSDSSATATSDAVSTGGHWFTSGAFNSYNGSSDDTSSGTFALGAADGTSTETQSATLTSITVGNGYGNETYGLGFNFLTDAGLGLAAPYTSGDAGAYDITQSGAYNAISFYLNYNDTSTEVGLYLVFFSSSSVCGPAFTQGSATCPGNGAYGNDLELTGNSGAYPAASYGTWQKVVIPFSSITGLTGNAANVTSVAWMLFNNAGSDESGITLKVDDVRLIHQ